MVSSHNKGITRATEKNDKKKPLKKCARPECNTMFPERGPKKYCSTSCSWTHHNSQYQLIKVRRILGEEIKKDETLK